MSSMGRIARLIGALLLSSFMLFSSGCGSDDNYAVLPSGGVGLVAFSNGWVGVINTLTKTVSTPFLVGELGAAGSALLDVVITPDRKTALVSSFGDATVSFIDMRGRSLLGSVTLSFFAEDIALTPDGKFALVTDGGFSPRIAVLDVENRTLVEEYTSPDIDPDPDVVDYDTYFNAVAVAADGETVLTVDYFSGNLSVLTIDDAGHLTFVETIDVSNGTTISPVNVSISPDGTTAIVAAEADDYTAASMRFPVLEITAPGVVALKGYLTVANQARACQSIVFNSGSTKAYALCTQEDPDDEDEVVPNNLVVALTVTGPGAVSDSGNSTEVDFIGTSQLFGVDTIALDRTNSYLYISNMTQSGAMAHLQVLNVVTGNVVKTISFDDVEMPPDSGTMEPALPMGVFIR